MKKISLLLCLPLFLFCKNSDKQKSEGQEEEPTAERVAEAHGIANFKNIEVLKFTFNVKVRDSVRTSRSWHWNTKTDEIRLTEGDISRTYTKRENLPEKDREIDQKFVNDTYWFLFPFQLVWSEAEINLAKNEQAPISKTRMDKLVVSYPDSGGYTPGDTYEIFVDEDQIIREWIYKSADGRRESPSTWEDYENFKGMKIAKSHKSPDGSFELYFSDIEVE